MDVTQRRAIEGERISDAVLAWMVKYDLLDAGNEYHVSDVLAVLDDLAPSDRSAAIGAGGQAVAFQQRVQPWMMACFGPEISADKLEISDRLAEEVLELLQSGGYPRERVAALTDYVYGREVGEPSQEVGGVQVTLAAYCLAHDLDMHECGETELARIWTKIDKIRAKQAAKPTGSALPLSQPHPADERVVAYRWREHYNAGKEDRWHLEEVLPKFSYDVEVQHLGVVPHSIRLADEQAVEADGLALIAAERRRQIEEEGWTAEHDDAGYHDGELGRAAAAYALSGMKKYQLPTNLVRGMKGIIADIWPWGQEWFKPRGEPDAVIRSLVKAGALIAAEIDQQQRRRALSAKEGR